MLHGDKQEVIELMDTLAEQRLRWIKRNSYYYKRISDVLKFIVPTGSRVLEVGCGTGELLHHIKPKRGLGIDISSKMIIQAKQHFPELEFRVMAAEKLELAEVFDYIIIADTIGYFSDVEQVFHELHQVCHPGTRIIILYQNFLWLPILKLAEKLKLKMPSKKLNWLNLKDLANLLYLENFDVITTSKQILLPKYIPGLSWFCNRYLAHLPLINALCLSTCITARPVVTAQPTEYSTSVIIPARNEKGNIKNALKRLPQFGKSIEVIFVEGHSTDDTLAEMQRVIPLYPQYHVRSMVQDGKGKGDAVRKGFAAATGDILMILDADLTVPPEDLPKFYHAIAQHKGEFINGSRLVYPMEKEAMQTLNMIANHGFSLIFSWLLRQRIKDTLCGTKVLFKTDYEKIVANRSFFGEFDPFGDFDLLFGAAKLNLKITEVPIRYQARQYGTTNISRFRHGWLLIKMVWFAMNKIKFI